jgi:hypothetical protein
MNARIDERMMTAVPKMHCNYNIVHNNGCPVLVPSWCMNVIKTRQLTSGYNMHQTKFTHKHTHHPSSQAKEVEVYTYIYISSARVCRDKGKE